MLHAEHRPLAVLDWLLIQYEKRPMKNHHAIQWHPRFAATSPTSSRLGSRPATKNPKVSAAERLKLSSRVVNIRNSNMGNGHGAILGSRDSDIVFGRWLRDSGR